MGLTEKGVVIFAPQLDKLIQKFQTTGNGFGGSAENLGNHLDKASGILSTIQNFIGTAFSSMKIDELIKKQNNNENVSAN
ncbi:hemolysin, chromosomal, partial [Vibrio parahaemolyticus]